MPYRFKRGEAVPEAVQRIAMEQIERAQKELRGRLPDAAEAVHQARKRFKKLRALVRLVRPVMNKKVFKEENGFFRDQARALASARDDQVMLDTLEVLAEVDASESFPEEWAGLHDLLTQRRDAHLDSGGEDLGGRMDQVASALDRYPDRLGDWQIPARGFDALGPGLERTYKDGLDALHLVCEQPTDVQFHEWRKRVKDHWYHTRLLEGMWREMMKARSAELARLSDLLGDDHDLSVFSDTLDFVPGQTLTPDAKKHLEKKVARRQKKLRGNALRLGERIYAEKPNRLRKRWGTYWGAWQRG
jgi:CHAD domain-containing protein